MSDVGMSADLELDIARALSAVDEVESALSAATSGVAVELDLSGVSAFSDAIAEAVAQVTDAPVDVAVEADASSIPEEITSAVDSTEIPDVSVDAQPDVSSIAPEIEDAVAAVEPDPVVIEADTTQAQEAVQELGATSAASADEVRDFGGATDALGVSAGLAQGSVAELSGAASGLPGSAGVAAGAVAVLGGVTAEFTKDALNAQGTTFRLNQILGDLASTTETINVGDLNANLEEMAIQLGSSDEAIKNSITNIVQLGQASGATGADAEATAEQFVGLAARAVALNPALGEVGDVADSLSRVMASGRTRGLVPFGISLNAADIQARALADTGKSSAAELNRFELAAAGAALATEKFGSHLQEDITKGAENPILKVRSLKTALDEAVEAIGQPLVAPVIDLLQEAEPDAEAIAEILGKLAHDALPGVTAALTAIGPPLQLVATILDLIPDPVLSGTIAFIGFSAALGAVLPLLSDATIGVALLESAAGPLAIAFAGVVAVMTLFGGSASVDTQKGIDEVTQALTDQDGQLRVTTEDLSNYIATTSEIGKDPDILEALNQTGLSFDDLGKLATQGDAGLAQLIDRLKAVGLVTQDTTGILHGASPAVDQLITDFGNMQVSTEAAAQAQLDAGVAAQTLTQEQVAAAESAHTRTDGTIDYVGALNDLQPVLDDATTAQQENTTATVDQADAVRKLNDEMLSLIDKTLGSFSAALQLSDAQIKSREAIDEATKATKDHSLSEDERTTKVNAAYDAILKEAGAARDNQQAQVEMAGGTFTATESQSALIYELTSVANTLDDGSPLKQQLLGYISTLHAVPTDVHTDAAIAVDDAKKRWQDYIQLLKTTPYIIETIANVRTPGPREAGGPVIGGEAYVVGEKGMELFIPDESGTIVPNYALQESVPRALAQTPQDTWSVDLADLTRQVDRLVSAVSAIGDRGPLMAIDTAHFGSDGAAADVEWTLRTGLSGI